MPSARHTAVAGPDWKLEKSEEGIQAYLRNAEGTSFKEFRGVMQVRGVRLSSMIATFDDTASYTKWMHNCTESRLLKYINLRERITYTVTHAPWPASDRDTVVHSIITQDPDNMSVTITITAMPDFIPRVRGRVRTPFMKATWTFTPYKSGVVMIVYQTVTDPGGPLPQFLLNLSVLDLPFYTMSKFKKVIREERYAKVENNLISEPNFF
ncbi:MAG: hypothetical protein E4G96_09770 [Chrysiogenales bacterium]|nr:MAG: hypothetical protein E4G96_09770 [Chrysiogenales bacterium]